MDKWVPLLDKNAWLQDYKGQTYSEKLRDELLDGIIKEHSKYRQIPNFSKFINQCNILTNKQKEAVIKQMEDFDFPLFTQQMGKKCIVTYIDEHGMIKEIGGSSILQNNRTGEIIDNKILNNFGKFLGFIFYGNTLSSVLKDDSNTNRTVLAYSANPFDASGQMYGRFGNSSTAVTNDDYTVNGLINAGSGDGAYKVVDANAYSSSSRRATYNLDLNPPVGSDTCREVGTFGHWGDSGGTLRYFMLSHDLTGDIPFSNSGLLRASFAWSIT